MHDENEREPVEELSAAEAPFAFPDQLYNDEDAEDNLSYVRGYN